MKKTNRNQNMPDQDLRNDYSANTGSLQQSQGNRSQPERFTDKNLNRAPGNSTRYDDATGTVENKIDEQ